MHDTVKIKTDTLTKSQLLVAGSPWKLSEAYYDNSGTVVQYIRGGINTTGLNYNVVRFGFNDGGTGIYITTDSVTYPLTWQLSNDQNTIQILINGTGSETWSLVSLSDSALYQTNYQTSSNVLESAKFIPAQ